jgi:hypothetical protein
MKISVRPGKRLNGTPKLLFDGQLDVGEVIAEPTGGVVLSVVGTDIYTPKASQRYSIELSIQDVEAVLEVLKGTATNKIRMVCRASRGETKLADTEVKSGENFAASYSGKL